MIRVYMLFFSFFIAFSNFLAAQTGQQLYNALGTGVNPRLQLQLSANGPGWGAFTIDYGNLEDVPWSSSSSNNWSSWNVFDTDSPSHYYGTITLKSNGSTVQWDKYVSGSDGYYLDGIILSYNSELNAYQLTADNIYRPGQGGGGNDGGPFPDTPLATPAVYPGTSEKIILKVVGDQIVDGRGNPILLKGIVRPSLEWSATGQYLSTQDLSNIANWNSGGTIARSNVIRLDLYQGYWLQSGPVTQSGTYKQIINAIVYYATQLGMAVILDLHWTDYGYQSPMANRDSITFWQQVATDYADFGTVLFELYNEPYGISQDIWLNGNETYAGYQELYDAVRSTGAQNICIIGGLDYAYDLSFVSPSFRVNGINIAYNSHPYNQKGQPGYQGPGGTFQQNYQGILGNFPLMFTEFGVNQASYFPNGYQEIYSNILAFANANNVHYTAFAWWVESGNPQFPVLIADWKGTALYGGILVHEDLVQNPGTLIPSTSRKFDSFLVREKLMGKVNFNAVRFGEGLFLWNFGDASRGVSRNPRISHTYAQPGSYVVSLFVLREGNPIYVTSRTISVDFPNDNSCVLVCPPRNVKGRQKTDCKGSTVNIISWEAPKSNRYCAEPVSYLVFRDNSLRQLVAEVSSPNKQGIYQVKDKVKRDVRSSYTVVAVDSSGNRSIPISVNVRQECSCCCSADFIIEEKI